MGLFSKKKLICMFCGNEYESRISFGDHVCPACLEKENNLRNEVIGYVNYGKTLDLLDLGMRKDNYNLSDFEKILKKRNDTIEKYTVTPAITKEEMVNATNNYKKLTDEQAFDVLRRIAQNSTNSTLGATYTDNFFMLSNYEKVIVDVDDIFAVGYTDTYGVKVAGAEAILCACFTNDPYVPTFPVVFIGKLGFFETYKSKKGRQGVSEFFESICPNLTYPVQDLNKLKHQILNRGVVDGNISMKSMKSFISSASSSMDLYNASKMHSFLEAESWVLINSMGYLVDVDINHALKLSKNPYKKFWEKKLKLLGSYR